MKYLYLYLVALFIGFSLGLSAQSFRLRAQLGTAGIFDRNQVAGPSAGLGLELLVPLSPRTFLVPEAGLQYTSTILTSFDDFPLEIAGFVAVDFNAAEDYQVRRTEATIGLGLEQHFERLRVQIGSRAAYRLRDHLTYTHKDLFSSGNRPDNVFIADVRPGERFAEGMQIGTLRYSQRINLAGGLSVRYDFTGRFELGFSVWSTLGQYQLERRVVSFCDGCPEEEERTPERKVDAGVTTIQISSRYTF